MRGSPEPYLTIVRSLQAENPFVPVRIVHETDVLDLEVQLSGFPLSRPRQVRLIELLPQFGDFNRIGRRKENLEGHRLTHHHAISFSRTSAGGLDLGMAELPDAVRTLPSSKVVTPDFRFNRSEMKIRKKIIPQHLEFSIDRA
jgi:hypothetical protein